MKFQLFYLCFIFSFSFIKTQNPKIDCSDKDNGFKFPSEKDCNQYNICLLSEAVEKYCPYGLHYDAVNQVCVNPNKIENGTCSFKEMCIGVDGKMYSHENCDKYYLCLSGEPVLQECKKPLYYDVKNEICQRPERIDGPCHIDQSMCKDQQDGKVFPHPEETKFYFCFNQIAVIIDCDEGLIFDKEKEYCVARGITADYLFPCNR